ncbi:MAG: arsenate reductase [candidate division Zixibacteria bacterium]|nr:arsenate reductase [candidate division Zixibacteria bacterium]
MKKIIFICTANSCRSQMAEGLLREMSNGQFEVYSAGTSPSFVNPLAIGVMGELGIDISEQRSESIDDYIGDEFDYVITVCGRAEEECPMFPGNAEKIHWPIDDPAEANGTEDNILKAFREARDDLKRRIESFIRESD